MFRETSVEIHRSRGFFLVAPCVRPPNSEGLILVCCSSGCVKTSHAMDQDVKEIPSLSNHTRSFSSSKNLGFRSAPEKIYTTNKSSGKRSGPLFRLRASWWKKSLGPPVPFSKPFWLGGGTPYPLLKLTKQKKMLVSVFEPLKSGGRSGPSYRRPPGGLDLPLGLLWPHLALRGPPRWGADR